MAHERERPVWIGRRRLLQSAVGMVLFGGCSGDSDDARDAVSPWIGEVRGTYGLEVELGTVEQVHANIAAVGGFWYVPSGRMWVVEYPAEHVEAAKAVYSGALHAGLDVGLLALFQKCPHLGCRVPECRSSMQFECPCHGSKYSRVGEKRSGPAPRGLDLFPLVIRDGIVVAQTGSLISGLAIGVDVTGLEAAGPVCIGEAEH